MDDNKGALAADEENPVDDHLHLYDLDLGLDDEIEEILPFRNA